MSVHWSATIPGESVCRLFTVITSIECSLDIQGSVNKYWQWICRDNAEMSITVSSWKPRYVLIIRIRATLFFVVCFMYYAHCLIRTMKSVTFLVRTNLNEKDVFFCCKLPHNCCLSFAVVKLMLSKYFAFDNTWLCIACFVNKDCYLMLVL